MTPDVALYQFFNGFGIPAYPNTAVPDDASFPYMTYSYGESCFGQSAVELSVDIFYYTESERTINAKAEEIGAVIDRGGETVMVDNGSIWLTRGTPWCQAIVYDTDPSIKQRRLNVRAEFDIV